MNQKNPHTLAKKRKMLETRKNKKVEEEIIFRKELTDT